MSKSKIYKIYIKHFLLLPVIIFGPLVTDDPLSRSRCNYLQRARLSFGCLVDSGSLSYNVFFLNLIVKMRFFPKKTLIVLQLQPIKSVRVQIAVRCDVVSIHVFVIVLIFYRHFGLTFSLPET